MKWTPKIFAATAAAAALFTVAGPVRASSVPNVTQNSSHVTTIADVSSSPVKTSSPLSDPSSSKTLLDTTPHGSTITPSSAGAVTTVQIPSKGHTHAHGDKQFTLNPKGTHAQQLSRTVPPAVPSGPTTMYDSANPYGIPRNAQAVAGYVTGPYAWTPQEWAMFPHAAPITIDILGGDTRAMVEDVEVGGVSVTVIHQWALNRLSQGYTPVIYSSIADRPAVALAMGHLRWHWWAANPTGSQNLVYGSQATQFAWNGNSNDVTWLPGSTAQLIH